YLYVSAERSQKPEVTHADAKTVRDSFASQGTIAYVAPVKSTPTPASSAPVSALSFQFGKVGSKPVSRWLMVAYDDLYSIQYMKKNLRPYWRRNGWEADDLLRASAKDYKSLVKRCEAFDAELMADMRKAGG